MSKLTDDLKDAITEAKGWITEIENRVQPVVGEVEKYADPFISALTSGLAAAGIAVPAKYAAAVVDLVSRLTQIDPADTVPAVHEAAGEAAAAPDAGAPAQVAP